MASTPVSEPFPRKAGSPLLSRASTAFGLGGFAAIGVYYALGRYGQDAWYVAIGLASVVAVGFGARRVEHTRVAWNLFAVGLLCNVIGDAITSYYDAVLNREAPVPSAADLFYLASYPLLALGIYRLLKELGVMRYRVAAFDAVIVAVAAGLVQWVFFVAPYLHSGDRFATQVVEIAYPSMDLLLFVALVQLPLGIRGRVVSYELLMASVLLWIVADEVVSFTTYSSGGWLDSFWLASYVLWGASALDASANRPPERPDAGVPRLTAKRVVVLAGALLTIPTVLLAQHYKHHGIRANSIAFGATLLTILVVLRFAGLLRSVERSRAFERGVNDQLRQLDRLKDEFVSTISHELRTPLTSINGYVELARERADPEARGYLDIVDRNAVRLLALVNDLLLVARIQSGEIELDRTTIDLAELVHESISDAALQAKTANVALSVAQTDDPVLIYGDRRRLSQVVDNLVSNAVKFSPEGGDVEVKLGRENGCVTVAIADQGIGIGETDRGRLFERFFRSQAAVDRQIPGTGLGLYISKAIADAHGGPIEARAEGGKGTVFVVALPPGAEA